MKSLSGWFSRFLVITLTLFSTQSYAQGQFPADLEIIGNAGALAPWGENLYLRISADGTGVYARYVPSAVGQPPIEESSFLLSNSDLQQIWQVIEDNGFFTLDSEFINPAISDVTFARLMIRANGVTHDVTTQNIAVAAFDNIISIINSVTPVGNDLVYDTSEPPEIIPRVICSDSAVSSAFGGDIDILSLKLKNRSSHNHSYDPHPGDFGVLNSDGAHPGTEVAYRMSLQEAVNNGIVTLDAKGDYYGDQVSITVDNTSSQSNNNLTVTLYLEFWGSQASTANVSRIVTAIENICGGRQTSDGRTFTVNVRARRSDDTSPPGTPGYHQIQLVEVTTSDVVGFGSSFDINRGSGSGTWETVGAQLDEIYAHEAGHLLGLPDRYDDYRLQADGDWVRTSDGQTFTTAQLADILTTVFPDMTLGQITDWLESPTTTRVTTPQSGHENDIMATLSGCLQQSDVDYIANDPGVVVEVRPGEVLVNKNGDEQNFVITRSEDVFVPSGESKTLEGLFVACVDLNKSIPSFGRRFDIAPPLQNWSGIAAADHLLRLVQFADKNEFFCESFFLTQAAIWRITDNVLIDDQTVENFLIQAGVEVGDEMLDFPRLSNPDPINPNTTAQLPLELFVLKISPLLPVVDVGSELNLSGNFFVPDLEGLVTTSAFNWDLVSKPAGSAAEIVNPQGATISLATDVRGIYRVRLEVDVTAFTSDTTSFTLFSNGRAAAVDELTETFESGDISNSRFFWQTNGDALWSVSGFNPHTGSFSGQSGLITDSQASSLEVVVFVSESERMSFAYCVSSEEDFDFLVFSVDDSIVQQWSGIIDWSEYSFELGTGEHKLTWSYQKDDSFSDGADRAWIDDVFFPPGAIFTSVTDNDLLPTDYMLSQNYPNPFNPETRIQYELPTPAHVKLEIFNLLGQKIRTLVDEEKTAGSYAVVWDGRKDNGEPTASGVYIYRLKTEAFEKSRKLLLLR